MPRYEPNRPWRPLYGTRRWLALRTRQLGCSPLCAYCLQNGLAVVAAVVDHIKPHKGDLILFWSSNNLQSLCKRCHDGRKKREEFLADGRNEIDIDGYPIKGAW